MQIDDEPITAQQVHEEDTEEPQVKGYDFERMIEEAMQKYGEEPGAAASQPAAQAQKKKPEKEKDEKQVKADERKKELLMKRKKYDPRAAIKKSK